MNKDNILKIGDLINGLKQYDPEWEVGFTSDNSFSITESFNHKYEINEVDIYPTVRGNKPFILVQLIEKN